LDAPLAAVIVIEDLVFGVGKAVGQDAGMRPGAYRPAIENWPFT
jgi:hypothetical protein